MKMILYVKMLVFMILTIQSCYESEDCHRSIEIVNNSNGELWLAEHGLQHSGLDCQQIPGLIKGSESYKLDSSGCWEDRIKGYQGAVVFYFFDENYFLTHSQCDPVEYNQSAIELRKYTVDDLNALNWVIEYP